MSKKIRLKRPSEKWRPPQTPMHLKLTIIGIVCLGVGIERRIFLVIGAALLGVAWLAVRQERGRLSSHYLESDAEE